MKKKKILIKNKGIVIEVPKADKYIFQFKDETGISLSNFGKTWK